MSKNIGIIYRNYTKNNNILTIKKINEFCKSNGRKFYLSNNIKLAIKMDLDGVYFPSFERSLIHNCYNLKTNFKIIGSAHNLKELYIKKLQKCSSIIYSRLFKVSYKYKKGFLGVVKFNLLKISRKEDLVPLGGIKLSNLNKLKLVNTKSFAIFSEVKKKPAKIFSRLF